jgi:hypothetical protein
MTIILDPFPIFNQLLKIDLNELIEIFIGFWLLKDEDYIPLNPSYIYLLIRL